MIKNSDLYENILIGDDSRGILIYDSIFTDNEIVYYKSILDEYLNLSFRLYNENSWENYIIIDTNIYVNRVDTFDFEFKY